MQLSEIHDARTSPGAERLGAVARTYGFWGRHPALYRLVSAPTFLFRENLLRGLAVGGLNLRPGNSVLEVACGTGLNLSRLREAVGETGRVVGFDLVALRGLRVQFTEEVPESARMYFTRARISGVLKRWPHAGI